MSHLQPFTIKELRTPQEIRRSIREDYDPVTQALRADTYRNLATANAERRPLFSPTINLPDDAPITLTVRTVVK